MEISNNIDRKTSPAEPHLLGKEEDEQPIVAVATNVVNHQFILASQSTEEQPLPSKPCASSQCHQFPHLVLNPANQQGHPRPQLAQSCTPFCLPHQHPGYGYHLPGVYGPHLSRSSAPIGTVNASWQASVSGPWDPSSWWGQVQLSQPHLAYTFPGSYPQFSPQQPMMSGFSAPVDQSSQRGIIRPSSKLSQKHQQMWEAQSAENMQLWTVIGQLQSEMADYRSKVTKLEVELSSLKQTIKEPKNDVNGTVEFKKPVKRGRPKRSAASVDVLPSQDESQSQGRKPKVPIFEKVILKPVHMSAVTQQGQEKVSNRSAMNGNNTMMPSTLNQVHDLKAIMQTGEVNCNLQNMKYTKDTSDGLTVLSQEVKGMDHRTALASFHKARGNGSVVWPQYTISKGENALNMNSQVFNNGINVIKQGEQVITGSGLENGNDDASDGLDGAEMEEDDSSNGEEITGSEGEDLPQNFST